MSCPVPSIGFDINFVRSIIFKRRILKMKNYIAPEMDIVLLQVEDIITSSDNEVDAGDILGDIYGA